MAWTLDGKPQHDNGFTSKGIQYPPGWIRNASPDSRTAVGILEVSDPKTWDGRFSTGWNESESAQIWRNLAEAKAAFDAKDDLTARDLISGHCARYVEKNVVAGTAIPDSVKTFRTNVLTAFATRKTERDACGTTEALQTLMTGDSYTQFPTSPDLLARDGGA